jgi:hypothetical protein
MRPVRLLMAGLAVCGSAAAAAGCGGSNAEQSGQQAPSALPAAQREVLGVVDALQRASRRGDGRTICADIFTPQLARSIATAAKRSCAKEVRARVFSPRAQFSVARDIAVTGERSTAIIRDQSGNVSKLFLVKQGGRWRIDRVEPQKAP